MSTPERKWPAPPPGETRPEPSEPQAPADAPPDATPPSAEPFAEPPALPSPLPAGPGVPEDLRVPWGWADLGYFILFALASSVVLIWIVALAAVAWGVTPLQINQTAGTRATVMVVSQALWSVAVLLYLFALVQVRRAPSFWRTMGWRPLRLSSMAGPPAGLVCLLGGIGLAVTTSAVSQLVGKRAALPIERLFQSRQSVLLLMALGLLVAPLVEETIFRGFIYPVIARSFGVATGVVATGLLFGLMHAAQLWGGWGQIGLLMVVGIVLTYARARTGTVLASFCVHLGYNGMLFLGFYYATGGLRHFPPGS